MLTITASSSALHRNKGTGLCQQGSCPSQPGVSLRCTLTQTPIFLREKSDYCRTDADLQFHCKPEELISFRGGVRKQGSNTYMSIDHQLPFFFFNPSNPEIALSQASSQALKMARKLLSYQSTGRGYKYELITVKLLPLSFTGCY